MTNKDLEKKLAAAEDKLEELAGLDEIYKGGITKDELKMFAGKWFVVGVVVGAIAGVLWL